MKRLNEAYAVLSDATTQAEYEEKVRLRVSPALLLYFALLALLRHASWCLCFACYEEDDGDETSTSVS